LSIAIIEGKITITARQLNTTTIASCKESDLKAGMGMGATIKNANMLLKDVKNTLTPVLARRYTAGSWSLSLADE